MEFEGRSHITDQLSMAPLIDVVFLLLIFFMLTSTFMKPESIDLTLPSAKTAVAADELSITVTLAREGVVLLNGAAVSLEGLTAAIRGLMAEDPHRTVGFRADAEASVQSLLGVVDAIREGGGHNLAMATTPLAAVGQEDRKAAELP